MAETSYFLRTQFVPVTLLRRRNYIDQEFVGGTWTPTRAIIDHFAGRNGHVVAITEAEARTVAPEAFTDDG